MNELSTQSTGSLDLSPRTFEQALTFAGYLADSDMVPKDFKGNPGNCLVAIQWGAELGLKPLQALQNLAIINGRPSLWGDAVIALVRGSPLCEWVIETDDGSVALCRVKRRGEPEQSRSFGVDDAKASGLHGKQGPWTQYPKRMRQMRARAFALRDVFPDVLRGLAVAEEIMDAPPANTFMGLADEVKPGDSKPTATASTVVPPALPAYPPADFDKNLPAWGKVVAAGKKTAPELLAMLSTKATFSEPQKARILSLRAAPVDPETPAVDPSIAKLDAAEGAAQ